MPSIHLYTGRSSPDHRYGKSGGKVKATERVQASLRFWTLDLGCEGVARQRSSRALRRKILKLAKQHGYYFGLAVSHTRPSGKSYGIESVSG